jgi:hypothetical protein
MTDNRNGGRWVAALEPVGWIVAWLPDDLDVGPVFAVTVPEQRDAEIAAKVLEAVDATPPER